MSQLSGFWYNYYATLLLLGWCGALIFPTVYALTMRFWQSELGMHFFSFGVVVWLNLTPGVLLIVFGDFSGRGIAGLVIFHFTVVVIWWRAIIFTKIYLKSRRNRKGVIATLVQPLEQDEKQ